MIGRLRSGVGDPILLLLVILLSLFGVAMVYSAGQLDVPTVRIQDIWRQQLIWLGIALIAFFIVQRIPVRWFEWITVPAYVLSIILLVVTLVIGQGFGTAKGTRSWLSLGPISFQPSQFANLAVIFMLARVMGSWREPPRSIRKLFAPVGIVALPMALVALQPDLGTALVYTSILLVTLYWSGAPVGMIFMLVSPAIGLILSFATLPFAIYMVALLAFLYFYRAYLWESALVLVANLSAGAIAIPLWDKLAQYQKNRLLVFLDPSIDPQGAGWHVIQSRVAIGSGGLFGKGFTLGTQKRLAFLPEQHTDFIFSVVGEEFGFVGTVGVLFIFGAILWRLARIAERCSDPFAGIVVFGIFGAWFAHIIVNVGMTAGVMPITGIPLPFLSYGGSFLVAAYLGLAVVQRIAAEQGKV